MKLKPAPKHDTNENVNVNVKDHATRRDAIWAMIVAVTFIGVVAVALLEYYPALDGSEAAGHLGEDYPNFFVRMVSAELLFKAYGLSHLIWFTPAMCAGGFQFANPIDITYALPQLLSMLGNPILAVYLTHVLMTILGGLGAFLLAYSKPFRLSLWPALAAAALFAMNGFFMARMVTGHLNFHTFMLIPLIAWCLVHVREVNLSDGGKIEVRTNPYLWLLAGTFAALLVIGGGAHLVIPAAISIFFVMVLAYHLPSHHSVRTLSLAVTVACGTALVLSAAKLSAAYALQTNFPRSLYDLQGIVSLKEAFWLPLQNIFWNLDTPEAISGRWKLADHEFEYSLSPFVLLGLIPAAFFAWQRRRNSLLTSLLLCLPFALLIILVNYHEPSWHEILKKIPVVSSSLSLFRWYASFLLVLCLIAGIGLQQFPKRWIALASLIVIIGATSWQLFNHQDWKSLNVVTYGPLLAGLEKTRTGNIEPISRLGVNTNSSGETARVSATSDINFLSGESQVFCYEPILGYSGEQLKIENLRIGPVTMLIGDELNMKNPACYLFPDENNCKAGDNFTLQQARSLYAFTHYQRWQFELPLHQKIANLVSLVSWLSLFACSLLLVIKRLMQWRKNPR